MIIVRRVFQAKAGQSGAVVGKLKEGRELFSGTDVPGGRIYTDYFSGNTDRVAWEIEVENLGALESVMGTLGTEATKFELWFGELCALIEGAHVEHWNIEV